MEKLIFKNSKNKNLTYKSGKLFCNSKFSCEKNCLYNTNCTGVCTPENGCSCPECDLILSYAIYAGALKNCPSCDNMLIRENILAISKIRFEDGHSFTCQKCKKKYDDPNIIVYACFKCNIKICPTCACESIKIDKINDFAPFTTKVGKYYGQGLFYCGFKYTEKDCCICRNCNGSCGPEEGCPCPICKIILEYNIFLNMDLNCPKCKGDQHLLKMLECMHPHFTKGQEFGFLCKECKKMFAETSFSTLYYCGNCEYHICAGCIYKKYLKDKDIKYPPLPKLKNISQEEDNSNFIKKEKEEQKPKTNGTDIKLKGYIPEDQEEEENIKSYGFDKLPSMYIMNDVVKKAMSINEKKRKEKEEEKKCIICNKNEKSVVFFPCKHMACCENCHESVDKCPICKTKIESHLKVFT